MSYILSVDIGTSKLCAVIFDAAAGELIGIKSCVNKSDVSSLSDGYHEQCPRKIVGDIFLLIKKLTSELSSKTSLIKDFSISGQMHGVVMVDKNCKPTTNLITWRDKRALELSDLLESVNTQDNFKVTGTNLHAGYGGATLACLTDKGMLCQDWKALSMADYLALRLTGIVSSESTHAASWGILDIQKNDWFYPLIEKL